jgi:deoxyribodipyrimidine photo-lyase
MRKNVKVFIFRRDLRVYDNTALIELSKTDPDVPIVPIFVFNPKQIDPKQNPYFSNNAVEFMIESLEDLKRQLGGSLYFYLGTDTEALTTLWKKFQVTTVAFNGDFTPFARKRDMALKEWCLKHDIKCIFDDDDFTLFPHLTIRTETGGSYEVFTPFYRKCISQVKNISKPQACSLSQLNICKGSDVPQTVKNIHTFYVKNHDKALEGGRGEALKIIKRISSKDFLDYEKERDFPALDRTTKMSAYLKFGCISIREAFWESVKAYGEQHGLVRELFWREFYANITITAPHVLQGQINDKNQSMKEKYRDLGWVYNKEYFDAWCKGRTGAPFVDAAMRCLNTTGFLHNRLRMVVAMYLTKDLLLDWRDGEKYFATKLIDYDPSSNNGGWQWSSSTGADSQPYFRVFNPYLQAKRFDPDCKFIKKWLPELKNIPNDAIHNWDKKSRMFKANYPHPIVVHSDQILKVKALYSKV